MIVYRFVDRDMFMRYRGGAVGHKSTRNATHCVFNDRDPLDKATERREVVEKPNERVGGENDCDEDVDSDMHDEDEEANEDEDNEDDDNNEEGDPEDGEGRDADDSENEESDPDSEPESDSGSISDEMEGFGEY